LGISGPAPTDVIAYFESLPFEALFLSGERLTLVAEWLERLDKERERTGEITAARLQRTKHSRERELFRDPVPVADRHPGNVRATGYIGELGPVAAGPENPERYVIHP